MKKRNIVNIVLVVVCLLVWGRSLYLIIADVFQGDRDNESNITPVRLEKPEPVTVSTIIRDTYEYQGKYRDPFKHWLAVPKPKAPSLPKIAVQKTPKKPAPRPPSIRFSGVMQDSTGLMAVLESREGEVYFVHRGDTVEGVTIRNISRDSLSCLFGSLQYKIGLSR